MRGEIRKNLICTSCINQRDYNHCHNQVANTGPQKLAIKCRLSMWEPTHCYKYEAQSVLHILHYVLWLVHRNCRDNWNTHFMFNGFFPENRAFYEIMVKNIVETGTTDDNMAHVLHLRLQTHIQNLWYLIIFQTNYRCTNAP